MKIIFLKFIKLILSVLLFIVIFCQNSTAQISQNQIIIDPYQTQIFIPGQSPGSAGISFSDSIPQFYGNSAGFSTVHHYSIFLSSSVAREWTQIVDAEKSFLKSENFYTGFTPGLFAGALPFRLFRHSVTVAASFNTEIPYEYQLYKDLLNRVIDYGGHLMTAKVAVGIELSQTMILGGGTTRWFGERKTIFSDPLRERTSEKSSRYTGQSFYVGVQRKITDKISLNSELYFPFQLKIDYHETERRRDILNSGLNHKFAGALQFGLNYKLASSYRIGAGYFYQKGFVTETSPNMDETEDKYSSMQSFSIGLGHQFTIYRKTLPVYLIYRRTRLPHSEVWDKPPPYLMEEGGEQSDRKFSAQILELGGNTQIRHVTVFLNLRWQVTGKFKKYPSALT